MPVPRKSLFIIILLQLQYQSNESMLSRTSQTKTSTEKYTTDCILSIFKSNIPTSVPVAVHTPVAWLKLLRQFQKQDLSDLYGDRILEAVHNNFISHRAFSYEDSVSFKRESSMASEVHVLLLFGSTHTVQLTLAWNMIQRIAQEILNPAVRVVFATSTAPETTLEQKFIALKLMQLAWEFGSFANAITLIPERYRNSSVGCNVFGWQLQDQKDECLSSIRRVRLIDRWLSGETKFRNVTLFKPKRLTSMPRCELNAFLLKTSPLHIVYKRGIIAGPYLQVFMLLGERLEADLFLQSNIDPETDLVFPVMYNRGSAQTECKRTYPYLKDDITWLVPGPTQVPQWQSLVRIFNPVMWLLVTVIFVLGTLTFLVIEITDNNLNKVSVTQLIMKALCTHLAISVTYKHGRPVPLLFFALWLIYCLQIYTAYQSSLIGFILNPGQIPPIRTFQQLNESGLDMLSLITPIGFEQRKAISYAYKRCPSTIYCLRHTIVSRNASILYYRSVTQVTSQMSEINLVSLEENVDTVYFSIQVAHGGCVLHEYLETLLGRLSNSGLFQVWNRDALQHAVSAHRSFSRNSNKVTFTLSHLEGAFFLYVFASFVSFVAFLAEIMIGYKK